MKKAQKIAGIVFVVTLCAALVYMVWGIYGLLRNAAFTSFPWWSACYFTAVYFGPVLGAELIVWLALWAVNKRGRRA